MAAGTGFSRVENLVPIPVPVKKPARNPRVYPDPCSSLVTINRYGKNLTLMKNARIHVGSSMPHYTRLPKSYWFEGVVLLKFWVGGSGGGAGRPKAIMRYAIFLIEPMPVV
jgi:hypothetical protein